MYIVCPHNSNQLRSKKDGPLSQVGEVVSRRVGFDIPYVDPLKHHSASRCFSWCEWQKAAGIALHLVPQIYCIYYTYDHIYIYIYETR